MKPSRIVGTRWLPVNSPRKPTRSTAWGATGADSIEPVEPVALDERAGAPSRATPGRSATRCASS